MNTKPLENLYNDRGYDANTTKKAVKNLLDLENYCITKKLYVENIDVPFLKLYIKHLVENEKNSLNTLLALTRYFHLEKKNEIYIYFTKILGGIGVLENIKKRTETYADKELCEEIFNDFTYPPLGTPPEDMPVFTNELMNRLQRSLDASLYQKILAGNNHGIPKESMIIEKELFEKASSFEEYLQERHQRKVAELQSYCDENKVWFEQIITQEMVDFVSKNQEILSAKKIGNKLYVTKIPYDCVNYLKENDPVKKSYYACHCPFARECILSSSDNIDSEWCYCSAGFAKFPFEVILDRELDVKLLKSALNGDKLCRFEIDLGDYTK